jgi:hypothetical protein
MAIIVRMFENCARAEHVIIRPYMMPVPYYAIEGR